MNDKLKRIAYIFSQCDYEFDESLNTVFVNDSDVDITFFSDFYIARFNPENYILDYTVDLTKCTRVKINDTNITSLLNFIFPQKLLSLHLHCKKVKLQDFNFPSSISQLSLAIGIKKLDVSGIYIYHLALHSISNTTLEDIKFPHTINTFELNNCNKIKNLIGMPQTEDLTISKCKNLLHLKGINLSDNFYSVSIHDCDNLKSLKGLKIDNHKQLKQLYLDFEIRFLDDINYSDYVFSPEWNKDLTLKQMELMIKFVRGEIDKVEYFKLYQEMNIAVIDYINSSGTALYSLSDIEFVAERIETKWD
jgi:hypothetical protein